MALRQGANELLQELCNNSEKAGAVLGSLSEDEKMAIVSLGQSMGHGHGGDGGGCGCC